MSRLRHRVLGFRFLSRDYLLMLIVVKVLLVLRGYLVPHFGSHGGGDEDQGAQGGLSFCKKRKFVSFDVVEVASESDAVPSNFQRIFDLVVNYFPKARSSQVRSPPPRCEHEPLFAEDVPQRHEPLRFNINKHYSE